MHVFKKHAFLSTKDYTQIFSCRSCNTYCICDHFESNVSPEETTGPSSTKQKLQKDATILYAHTKNGNLHAVKNYPLTFYVGRQCFLSSTWILRNVMTFPSASPTVLSFLSNMPNLDGILSCQTLFKLISTV